MIVDPETGAAYEVFDAHTHWSRLVCRTMIRWPFKKALYLLAIHELVDYLVQLWPSVAANFKRSQKNALRAALLARALDFYHLDRVVVLPIFGFDNALVLELAELLPGRVVPFTNLNPRQKPAKLARTLAEYQDTASCGVKLAAHFQRFHFREHRAGIERVFAWADAPPYRVVLFHTGSHSDIRDLEPVVREYPRVPVILGHSGLAPQVDQALALARACANVYLETSGQPYTYLLNVALRDPAIGVDRVLYGSDLPTLHPLVEQERVLALRLSPEERARVFAGNLARLLETRRVA